MNLTQWLFVFIGVTFSLSIDAKEKVWKPDKNFIKSVERLEREAPIVDDKMPSINMKEIRKRVRRSEKVRTVAQSKALTDANLKEDVKRVRNEFFALRSGDGVANFLIRWSKPEVYNGLSDDAKFIVAQIAPLIAFRGLAWKLRPLFEDNAEAIHSLVLTTAKRTATNFNIYLPMDHMDAVFEFFTDPYKLPNGNLPAQFNEGIDLQAWIGGSLSVEIEHAIIRLSRLNPKSAIIWDQRLSFGPKSFKDNPPTRFRYIGNLEIELVKGAMYSALASTYIARAYSVKGSINLAHRIGRLYGLDGFISDVEGVSAEATTRQIRDDADEDFGILYVKEPVKRGSLGFNIKNPIPIQSSYGARSLVKAMEYIRSSVSVLKAAWDSTSSARRSEKIYAIDTGYWRINRTEIEENLANAYRVVTSQKPIKLRSQVTGETIDIHFQTMFLRPPFDVRVLLPTKFEPKTNSVFQSKIARSKIDEDHFRNYKEGSPTEWRIDVYKRYFPHIETHKDVFKTFRVLSHSGGNWLKFIQ